MSNNDYYQTLGVEKSASADEIRKAYKKLVRENHPDVKPDDQVAAEKFKQVQEAYSILGDEEKRSQFDQFGTVFPGGAGGNPFQGGGSPIDLGDIFGGGFGGGGIDLNDIFGGSAGDGMGGFGGGQRRSAPPRQGDDIQLTIQIPFQVAVEGGDWDVHLRKESGTETLTAKIPAGIDQGQKIRLAGQGQTGAGGAGNLILTIRIDPHPWFRRENNDLILELPLTPPEATLGTKVSVPTLSEGDVMLTIPKGTSSGTRLRLKEKGVLDRKTNQRGHQYVIVKIVVSKELDAVSSELYEQLQETSKENPREGLWL